MNNKQKIINNQKLLLIKMIKINKNKIIFKIRIQYKMRKINYHQMLEIY